MSSDLREATEIPRAAAFFDLDHVMIAGSAAFYMARAVRQHDVYRVGDLLRVAMRRSKSRLGQESHRDRRGMGNDVLEAVRGREQSEVQSWGRQVAAYEILPRVYPDITRLILAHHTAGDCTYLVTSAPTELAQALAQALDMDGAMGTDAALDAAGRYTGERIGPRLEGPAKRTAIIELADREGFDLRRCHVYANGVDDKDLLKSVGFPHAVNPDSGLLRTAVRRGWAVHEMRPLRRKILVGAPPAVPIGAVIASGYLLGRQGMRARRP
jgi:HAD superfamily hydrolase (TIGR01490 family)